MRLSAILLSVLPVIHAQVIQGGWTAFGDSYAAGIGAGGKHASDSGKCRRRVNAYPSQLQADGSLAAGMNVEFSFQACSSAKIPDVVGQIATFRDGPESLRGFATISIGGNDAGFSDIIEACLVRAKFGSPSCDSVLASTTETVNSDAMRQNLEDAYRAVLDAAKAPGKLITSFRLVVTGYPRFFNEETTDCNDRHMSFWGFAEPNKQYLTVERRKALNKLVTDMNNVVQAAAEAVSKDSTFGQVVFVSIDELFEGHRFCEPGITEPDNKNSNTWFFLLQGRDVSPDGSLLPPSYPDEPVNLTPSECDAILNGTTPPLGDGWGEFMLCAAQEGTAEGKQLADWITDDSDGDLSGGINIPEAWGKAFHPKSIGHARIKQAIINRLNSPGASYQRVLIMHDGTQDEFDAMVNLPFNSKLDAQRIEQPDISLRGYAVWIEVDAARKIRDIVPGVVGVLFEASNELPPTWPNGASAQESASVVNATRRSDGALQKRIPSAATATDLDFERHMYAQGDNVNIWHLGVLSKPPVVTDERYFDFGLGYLHDPNGGSGVNVYVLDSGANLDHREISGRLRTDGHVSYVTRASKLGVIDDTGGHGTCMASLIGGTKYGVTKKGHNIIPVRWEEGSTTGVTRGASLFEGLLWILSDVKANNKQGKAVINFSAGTAIAKWADDEDLDNAEGVDSPIYLKYDPWYWFLPYFKREDVVVVCAAGNTASAPEDWWVEFPRRHAHQGFVGEDSLIVVGGTDQEGKLWKEARGGTNRFFSIITAYAPGSQMTCADPSDIDAVQQQAGTSCSTALVSGLIATFLDRADLQATLQVPGSVAAHVKSFVKDAAQYHTDQSAIDPDAGTPLNVLGTHNYVPCDTPATSFPGGQVPSIGNTFAVRRGDTFYNPGATCVGLIPKNNVGPFTYQGCVQEQQPDLVLREGTSKQQTLEACAAACQEFAFFGMAHGDDCYCGTATHNALPADSSACSTICPGDSSEICGGQHAISLYGGNTNPSSGLVGAVPGWTYSGCYVDADTRTLGGDNTAADDMTPAQCADFCESSGYTLFGVEYGTECWCGSNMPDASLVATDGGCNVRCGGDDTLLCGGGWRLTLYQKQGLDVQQVQGWEYSSCYVDSDARVLPVGKGSSTQMTPAMCAQLCCGYRLFGVENGNECWCGDSVDTTKQAPAGDCSISCAGDAGVQCGGGWRINVYQDLPGDAPGCTASTSTTSTRSTLSTSTRTPSTSSQTSTPTTSKTPTSATTPPTTMTTSTRSTSTTPAQPPTTTTTRPSTSSTPPTCPASIDCDASNCAGTFDSGGVRATCKGALSGCVCHPTSSTCGNPASCDAGGCAGSFDSDGQATCKGNYATCHCLPQDTQCGTPLSCNLNGCAGSFDSDGQATCKGKFAGCKCVAQAEQCGTPQSCNLNGCAGTFDSDGRATCKGKYYGCQCVPQSEQCGTPQSCNLNGCAGSFDSDGQATCKGAYAGCKCLPQAEQCGAQASCDAGGCAGTFDSDGIARCKANYAGCRCTPTTNTCGTPASCDTGGCAGTFDSDGFATCKAKYAGCKCNPTSNTCGAPQSCDLNGCAGTFDADGFATCKGKFASCRCSPTTNTCGAQQSCDLNGCAGAFDSDGIARCKGNYATCRCTPTSNTCGAQQSCDLNGCAGTFDSDGIARCKGKFATCKCNPTSNTCGTPQSCDLNGCAGSFNSNTGQATCKGKFATCPCIATSAMCGTRQSCDLNNCAGRFTGNDPYGHCTNWWKGCECLATANTCGARQSCDLNGCDGTFDINSLQPYCRHNFLGCACNPTDKTCGIRQACSSNGCAGTRDSDGVWRCKANYGGCKCFVARSWGLAGGGQGTCCGPAVPLLDLWGNDNECTNIPSDWNDRIYEVDLFDDGVNCEFHRDINCSGGYVFFSGPGAYNMYQAGMPGQASSFKCWRSDGNNNSQY